MVISHDWWQKMPLCCGAEVLLVMQKIAEVFKVLVLACSNAAPSLKYLMCLMFGNVSDMKLRRA
jgi:hypothetical protein